MAVCRGGCIGNEKGFWTLEGGPVVARDSFAKAVQLAIQGNGLMGLHIDVGGAYLFGNRTKLYVQRRRMRSNLWNGFSIVL